MNLRQMQFLDAAISGNMKLVGTFLKKGIDPNTQDSRGLPTNRTALMHAAENGHVEIVELLVKSGAKINAIDKGFPIDCPGGNTALILAIQKGQTAIAHRLLDAGASPRTKGGGTSVINAAAYYGDAGLVKRLVELGADPNQRDGSRCRPIHSAVSNSNVEVVKLLLDLGIDPNSPGPFGSPILITAVYGGNIELCNLLVTRGANPELGNSDGFTPLMMACRAVQKEAVAFLLSLKVNVNAQDNRKRTALDIALDMQRPPDYAPEVLNRLLELGQLTLPSPEKLHAIVTMLRIAGAKPSDNQQGESSIAKERV